MNFLDYLFNTVPSQGGLLATNYPNPYGLRAFVKPDGTYGGEMMPKTCLLYTSPSPRDGLLSRMPSSA